MNMRLILAALVCCALSAVICYGQDVHEVGETAFKGLKKEVVFRSQRSGEVEFRYINPAGITRGTERYSGTGVLLEQRRMEGGVLEGKTKRWFDGGRIKEEIEYKDGLLDGRWKTWDESGFLESDSEFRKGAGVRELRYKSGDLKLESPYVNGVRHGHHIEFYPNGKIEYFVQYKAGKPVGLGIGFYESGRIRYFGNCDENGELDGAFVRASNQEPPLVSVEIYKKGEEIWSSESGLEIPEAYRDGNWDGQTLLRDLEVPEEIRKRR